MNKSHRTELSHAGLLESAEFHGAVAPQRVEHERRARVVQIEWEAGEILVHDIARYLEENNPRLTLWNATVSYFARGHQGWVAANPLNVHPPDGRRVCQVRRARARADAPPPRRRRRRVTAAAAHRADALAPPPPPPAPRPRAPRPRLAGARFRRSARSSASHASSSSSSVRPPCRRRRRVTMPRPRRQQTMNPSRWRSRRSLGSCARARRTRGRSRGDARVPVRPRTKRHAT